MKLQVPNIRKMLVPDEGYTLYDVDLKGADARVVAWEAGDEGLKDLFRSGIDVHAYNANDIFPHALPSMGFRSSDLFAFKDKRYPRLLEFRHKGKTGVHAVDYGCKARTLAEHLNITTNEAEAFIQRWFTKHPQIKQWHDRVARQLHSRRFVTNIWGYKRYYFDRLDDLLPKALAWIGQSTTAIAINKLIIMLRYDPALEQYIQILLQTHDSVTFQIPTAWTKVLEPVIKDVCSSLVIPYPDPMEMPCEISKSSLSWGDVEEIK